MPRSRDWAASARVPLGLGTSGDILTPEVLGGQAEVGWWEAVVGRGVKRVVGKVSDPDIRKERQNDRGGQHRERSQ